MKILYRDYIAMLVVLFIPMFMLPEITIFNIKFYGLSMFIILLWYLGATRIPHKSSSTKSKRTHRKCDDKYFDKLKGDELDC